MMRTPRGGRPDLVSDALRQLWATAESDPVPDEFLDLLDQLDQVRATTNPAPKPATGQGAGDEEGEPTA